LEADKTDELEKTCILGLPIRWSRQHIRILSLARECLPEDCAHGVDRKKMNSTGAQDWRAIALIAAGGERLLCLGESASQVRAAYAGAWTEVIRDEDRPTVKQISLQKWAGKVWQGQWEHQSYLTLPTGRGARVSHDGDIAIAEDLSAIDDELIIEPDELIADSDEVGEFQELPDSPEGDDSE
jgi:hypothetical protein